MNERVVPGPVQDSCGIREAVCIHTKKIYDSCRDKDCIEDLRVYPTRSSQAVIDRALSVRGGRAELLQAYIDVEPASYNRGYPVLLSDHRGGLCGGLPAGGDQRVGGLRQAGSALR